jgi:hypothetical protein
VTCPGRTFASGKKRKTDLHKLNILIIPFQKWKNKENTPKRRKKLLDPENIEGVSDAWFDCRFSGFTLSCSKGDDFEAIRKLIDKGVALGRNTISANLMKLAGEDFIALPGDLDRRSTRAILWRAFNYYGAFKIIHPRPSVDVESDGKKASAGLPFLILRKDVSFPKLRDLRMIQRRWLEEVGENADLYRLDMELAKEKRTLDGAKGTPENDFPACRSKNRVKSVAL